MLICTSFIDILEKTRVDRLCGSGGEVTKVKWRFVFKDKKGDVEI
jgi:hypothetical protein